MEVGFESEFIVTEENTGGRQFENVSRLICKGIDVDTQLLIDINSSIYNLEKDDKFNLVLATKINDELTGETKVWHPSMNEDPQMRQFEYVLSGKVFVVENNGEGKVNISVSFGGLLMKLTAEESQLTAFSRGQNLFLLIKKV